MIRFLQTPGRFQKVLLVGFLSIVCIMMVVTLVPGGILGDFGRPRRQRRFRRQGRWPGCHHSGSGSGGAQHDAAAHIPEQFKSYILPQAVDAVVMQKVYLREAKRLGLEATDDDLRYEMQHGGLAQALYPNGTFIGADQYRDLVASQFNLSVPQFEQELRDELTMRKLRSVIGAGVFVSNAEVHDAFVKAEDQGQV